MNLEAPHKEKRTKGGQLGLETRTTSNSPPTVAGDRESPTTARENKIHHGARLKEVKRGETLERIFLSPLSFCSNFLDNIRL